MLASLGPEHESADGCSTVHKIRMEICKDGIILINYFHLKFKSVNYLNISRPLKQLSKVSVRCRSQKQFMENFLEIIVKFY